MHPPYGELATFEDAHKMSAQACIDIIELSRNSISQRGVFRISLAGGSTPKLLYGLMADHKEDFQWDRIELYWGDERNVPPDDADSNYRMVREALLDRIAIPQQNVFPVPIEPEQPEATAIQYEATLRSQFGAERLAWDLVLLGMGDDAHTASLFPGTLGLQANDRQFTHNWVDKFEGFRQTLTAGAINSAREIWFLIAGAAKREAIEHVWSPQRRPELYPSQMIRPSEGRLRWMVTTDAVPS